MKIVALSDTHNQHSKIDVPEGDILLHIGDATSRSTLPECVDFANWLVNLPHKHKVLVWGNHDAGIDHNFEGLRPIFKDVHVLQSGNVEIEGLKIWGLSYPTKYTIEDIPTGLDILLCHYPAMGILDEIPPRTKYNPTNIPEHAGNPLIFDVLTDRRPRYFFCGHIHESFGYEKYKDTNCYNCSQLDEHYQLVNKPWVIDIEPVKE